MPAHLGGRHDCRNGGTESLSVEGDYTVNARNIRRFAARLQTLWAGDSPTDLYYVTVHEQWVFYWIAHDLTTELRNTFGLRIQTIDTPDTLQHQLIHFGDRYAYLNGTFRTLHPSNTVFLTWFHGDPQDPRPHMQAQFQVLPEAAEHIAKIVTSCRISKDVLLTLGIPEEQVTIIPIGIDLSRFTPGTPTARRQMRAALGIPEDAVCLGSFQKDGLGWEAGLDPKLEKGPDVLLATIQQLKRRYANLFVLLTGPARGYIIRGLQNLNVPYVHHYLPHYHDIIPYYHALDLYVISSRCEGGPKALLESWATGVPVVSTRMGMAADWMRHGGNGMLAEVEDPAHLAEGASALLEDRTLRDACCRQGYDDVQQFDWPIIADHYYRKLYQAFLE
ncbi:glycosyltransferase [candidate division KSB3 bacterium]|uniref:Glycosyltransferase n=1 Tax=candidate division KSB3 bacterium TaxID=2044937 RepID=A0A9D5JXQ1_9BACT|nr:glycosyltransferase [candidate division KSB3 bacterium]MBD3326088.1 glycosyltransferase [candidate division KSB3 bacterium]